MWLAYKALDSSFSELAINSHTKRFEFYMPYLYMEINTLHRVYVIISLLDLCF